MLFRVSTLLNDSRKFLQPYLVAIVLGSLSLLVLSAPASAHHATEGRTPSNFFEGFLSGIAHPVIGIDHLAFVVAAGLLAVLKKQGISIPIAFVVASLMGTGIHLMSFDLPFPELFISASVVAFGAMLAIKNSPNLMITTALAAIAGIFHGYAYGESIVGAEMTPLVAYLAGFTVIQLTIAVATFLITRTVARPETEASLSLRFAGFTICGVGVAFLSSAVLG